MQMKYHPKEIYYEVKDGVASVILDYGENKTTHVINATQQNAHPTAFVVFMRGVIVGLILALLAAIFVFGSG